MPPVVSSANAGDTHESGVRYGPALTLLASLFFMWGFITVINNTLLPHLRSVFDLTYTQTTLIESCGSSPTSSPPSLRQSLSNASAIRNL